MAEHSTTYEKFPGKHRKFVGTDRLWFGQDHLLLVSSTGISEDYKRFYFKDIQAFNIIKTRNHMILMIIGFLLLGITAGLSVWLYKLDNHNAEMLIPGSIIGFIFICYLAWLFIKGPSCKSFVYSSVQKERLTPLKTIKKARKFLGIILPKIEASQGTMDPQLLNAESRRVTAAPSAILKHAKTDTKKIISPYWHRILFLSLMCLGILLSGMLIFRSPILFAFGGFVMLLVLMANTTALVKQTGSALSSKAKAISITSMVFLILSIGCGYIEFVFFMVKNMEQWAKSGQNQWELTKLYAQINPFDYPVILGMDIFFISVFFILGLTGLIVVWQQEK